MATVYLAHDLRHDRKVAVKVLREKLFASLGKEHFLREIRWPRFSRVRTERITSCCSRAYLSWHAGLRAARPA